MCSLRTAATSPFRLHRKVLTNLKAKGFTLVEVVLAIGIVAFAFVGLLALMPAGLSTFRKAMNTSVGAQVAQQLSSEIEQTDFDSLLSSCQPDISAFTSGSTSEDGILYWKGNQAKFRYFDDQGNEVTPSGGGDSLQTQEKQRILYWALTRVARAQLVPGSTTSVQGRSDNKDLVQITIQVLENPSNTPPNQVSNTGDLNHLLLDPAKTPTPYATYVMYVARNGYAKPGN